MAAANYTVPGLPGLECLTQLTTIGVNQVSAGGYHGNSYAAFSGKDLLFNLVQDVSKTDFIAARVQRPFHIDGMDSTGKKVFSLNRQLMAMLDTMEVYVNDALVSVVRLEVSFTKPIFSISDAQDHLIFKVKGQFLETTRYRLQTANKIDVGSIYKKFLSWGRVLANLENDYVINLPADLAVQFKLAVIAACVFIDYIFLETK